MLVLVNQVGTIIGVFTYELFLKIVETRWLLFWNVIVSIFGAFLNYVFAMRWNLACNINDHVYLIVTTLLLSAL